MVLSHFFRRLENRINYKLMSYPHHYFICILQGFIFLIVMIPCSIHKFSIMVIIIDLFINYKLMSYPYHYPMWIVQGFIFLIVMIPCSIHKFSIMVIIIDLFINYKLDFNNKY
jgi:hypothetical protein